uniref:[histone H3]-lysine(4) N-methyltransferase n=1 Tax=Scophthalmus maximus TaxID=52904 RepID=A0A8D2ZRT1_SCOMX
MKNQTAATSARGTRHYKLVSTLMAVKGAEKASKVKEQGEVSEDSDTDQSQPQSSVNRLHTRRTSQAGAPSFKTFHRRQRKRIVKSMGASPEAGAEAGAQSGEEAAMPLECKAAESSEKPTYKRSRKSLFGYKRKPPSANKHPKLSRNRTRRVFYTYIPEPIPATLTLDGNKQQLQETNITKSEGEPSSFPEQRSNNSSTPLMSARSSRVIKAPKRFLDEEMIKCPKGPVASWLKSQQREEGKASASLHESGYDANSLPSDSDTLSLFDSPSAVTKFSPKPSPGTTLLFLLLSGTDQTGSMTGDSQEALEVSGPSHRIGLSGANKRMLHLLKKAKVQLIKIDQQKQLKLSQVKIQDLKSLQKKKERFTGLTHCQNLIKHVCRAAAVALGQPRAMVPDDIPRLSALPMHEREGITFSPTTEVPLGKTEPYTRGRGKGHRFRKRRALSRYGSGGVRSRRCGHCEGCLIEEDCAKCINCLDKPKFGGPNTKRQCCIVLTSVPTTPQPVCLLCASKGRHEMIFCQICCEPFHSFCLSPEERPQQENKENWCCRRCKFCHVCGRKSKSTKPVLQCRRCQTSYHPSCLGPTYPKPMNCSMPWVCMTCIRCKSCGVTPGKTWDFAWNHEQNLCPDCTSLHSKGNFCTVCHKCYDDNNQHAQMIQCSECSHWIHYKCEGLSGALLLYKQTKLNDIVIDEQLSLMCPLFDCSCPSFYSAMLPEAVLPPSKEHSYAQWLERTYQPKESRGPQSGKSVSLLSSLSTQQSGASHSLPLRSRGMETTDAGRLLYLGQNEWAHINCCLWSAEVYEDNSALLRVHSAVSRGRHLRCDRCGQSGATVGCCLATCQSNFHFMCARAQSCVFQQDRKMYCYKHRDLVSAKVVCGKGFEVPRRVYVDFEGINFRRKFLTGLEPESINMTIGSLQIQKLGVLSELSSNGRMLYPVDFLASSEAEDAAVATTNGISLAPDNLEEEVAHLMSQELPYTVFDTDTEVAVASMLNAKLDFDEALLTENVVLHCSAQGGRGEVEGAVQDVEMQQENDSVDEDSSRYFKFSRTVVCDAASGSDATGQLPSAPSISQLDGADSGTDSDESEVGNDGARDINIHTNNNTPTKQLTVALKRLDSSYTVSTVHCSGNVGHNLFFVITFNSTGFSSEEDAPAPKHRKRTYMNQPHLRFEITSEDGFSVKANSIEVAWRAVIDGVLEARAGFHLKQLPLGGMSGPRVLGVVHDAVIFLLEQLQGATNCKYHRFRFHRCDDIEEELPLNPSGCARTEVYTRKATFDMFNFLASQHREPPDIVGPFDEEEDEFPLKSSRRATSSELPMAMRFRHLEKISKEAVGVYRSQIHGRGLYCKRNIEAGEMVIEYAGTVIRSVLTDKREQYYDSKDIGCYMFRIDDFDVVDATMQGNAARFINHSCEPNCYSRVINVDGRKHIVIFALRKIYRGEELTYDYKFPIEDENNKLHCNCATRRCRRFLN